MQQCFETTSYDNTRNAASRGEVPQRSSAPRKQPASPSFPCGNMRDSCQMSHGSGCDDEELGKARSLN